ncbi:MAG: Alpha/Beta hydrolase protein [Benjaminiella poitrasii]|nr:MAG: Alpha/Beta hydrolase protein [Benjaminiella poitrasii]
MSSSEENLMDAISDKLPERIIPFEKKKIRRIKRRMHQKLILSARTILSTALSLSVLLFFVSIAIYKTGKSLLLDTYIYRKTRQEELDEPDMPDELFTQDETYYADRWGYTSEMHEVITKDGYILKMYRIYKKGSHPQGKRPVLIGHGLFQCSGAFVLNEERSLAFMLADEGYDVWVGNNRSISGYDHISLSHKDPEYWNWGLKELGMYDFCAMIKHVKIHSGFSKVAYIGHSQGNAQAFIALSLCPEICSSLSCFVALAPAVFSGDLVKRKIKYFQFTPRPVSVRLIADWLAGWGRKGTLLYVADQDIRQNDVKTTTNKIPLVVFYGTADYLVNGERFVRTFPGYEHHGLDASGDYGATTRTEKALFSMLELVHVERLVGYEHMDTIWGHDNHKTTYPIILKNFKNVKEWN